jgi:hypothetical protein
MQATEIFGPFFAMILLTFVVWVVMYIGRIRYSIANRVNAQRLGTPEKVVQVLPEEIQYPAYNLTNLLELPIIFYALCLYLFVSGNVDALYVIAAWSYVALRAVHSVIQCTSNIVMRRFAIYMASSVVLWSMVLRAALGAF